MGPPWDPDGTPQNFSRKKSGRKIPSTTPPRIPEPIDTTPPRNRAGKLQQLLPLEFTNLIDYPPPSKSGRKTPSTTPPRIHEPHSTIPPRNRFGPPQLLKRGGAPVFARKIALVNVALMLASDSGQPNAGEWTKCRRGPFRPLAGVWVSAITCQHRLQRCWQCTALALQVQQCNQCNVY